CAGSYYGYDGFGYW
nr:immunoglobulin heavy chain junction region [Mus musculus]MBK4187687.1 immunoglobulin heavy chain junction region [Mus musculus]